MNIVLDSLQADYMTNVYTNMYKGLIVRVHDRQHKPQMKDAGTYVPVGFHTNIAISKIQVQFMRRYSHMAFIAMSYLIQLTWHVCTPC